MARTSSGRVTAKARNTALDALAGVAILATVATNSSNYEAYAAQQEQCSPLYQTSTGREVDASYSAHNYSQENKGAVGIAIFAGPDLGNASPHLLGTKLVQVMRQNGLESKCFVHHTPNKNGTSVTFKIDGLSIGPDSGYGIAKALEKETLRNVVLNARTAQKLLPQK